MTTYSRIEETLAANLKKTRRFGGMDKKVSVGTTRGKAPTLCVTLYEDDDCQGSAHIVMGKSKLTVKMCHGAAGEFFKLSTYNPKTRKNSTSGTTEDQVVAFLNAWFAK